jgi:hypothetical protein
MASVFTNINTARMDERIIRALRNSRVALDLMSFRMAPLPMLINEVVRVPLATDPTVDTKTPGELATPTGALTGVDVTLNQPKQATWDATEGLIDPNTISQYWEDKAAGAVAEMAHTVIIAALGNVTAANYGDTAADKLVTVPASFMQEDLARLWELGQNKIKDQEQSLLLNTAYSAAILAQPGLGLLFAQTGNNIVSTGKLPVMMGMTAAHYGRMPSNSQSLGGMVMGRAAIAVAMAAPAGFLGSGDGDIKERRVITDPESGLSCMYTVVAQGGGKLIGEVSCLYGTAKAQNSIVRLASAA